MKPHYFGIAAMIALQSAAPATAVVYTAYAAVASRHFVGTHSLNVYDHSGGPAGPIAVTGMSGDGYAAAFASSDGGGTVSATAFGRRDGTTANGQLFYDIFLDAPATTVSKVRVGFSGLLSSWGSGSAKAAIVVGPETLFFYSYDPGGRAKTVPFRLTRTVTLTGGSSLALGIFGVASVNFNGAAPADYRLGFASAYVDPTVTFSAAVPEPASWALLIAGFGMTGAALRRRTALLAA